MIFLSKLDHRWNSKGSFGCLFCFVRALQNVNVLGYSACRINPIRPSATFPFAGEGSSELGYLNFEFRNELDSQSTSTFTNEILPLRRGRCRQAEGVGRAGKNDVATKTEIAPLRPDETYECEVIALTSAHPQALSCHPSSHHGT
jgi:hypothetical protein